MRLGAYRLVQRKHVEFIEIRATMFAACGFETLDTALCFVGGSE